MSCSRSRREFSISSRSSGWSKGAQAAATRAARAASISAGSRLSSLRVMPWACALASVAWAAFVGKTVPRTVFWSFSLRQNGIRVQRSRKFKRTTDSDHAFNIAPNLLQQDFTASGPNQKWPYGGASTAYRLTGRRHHLSLDAGGMGLSGRDH